MLRNYTRIYLINGHNIVINVDRVILLIGFFISVTLQAIAQPLALPPKLFTMKQSRVSIGFGIEYGPRLTYFAKADQYKIRVEQIIYEDENGLDTLGFNFGIGIGMEWFSPFSIIGFHNEINFHTINYRYNIQDSLNDYEMDYLEMPICLKFKFGGALKKSHLITMFGAGYMLPTNVRYTNPPNEEIKDKERLKKGWEYIAAIGFDTTFGRIPDSEVKDLARGVGLIKLTYRHHPFNTTFSEKILIPIENNTLDFSDYFFTGCLQWYF